MGEAGGEEVRSLIGYSGPDFTTYGYDYDPCLRETTRDMWKLKNPQIMIEFIKLWIHPVDELLYFKTFKTFLSFVIYTLYFSRSTTAFLVSKYLLLVLNSLRSGTCLLPPIN